MLNSVRICEGAEQTNCPAETSQCLLVLCNATFYWCLLHKKSKVLPTELVLTKQVLREIILTYPCLKFKLKKNK